MTKVMVVTVGTSLFHSASWEPTEPVLRDVSFYEKWTEDDRVLKEPETRKRLPFGDRIQQRLELVLRTDNAPVWTGRLDSHLLRGEALEPSSLMRFSAELATILKLYEVESEGYASLAEFLRSYRRIDLPYDSSGQGEANLISVAAHHLAAYLNRLAESPGLLAQPVPFAGLSSTVPEILLGENSGLGRLAHTIVGEARGGAEVDLVVSGGYKLYGIYLSQRLAPQKLPFRLFYIHESASRLVKMAFSDGGISFAGLF